MLLSLLIGLAIGCIFPAAVFIVLWITGQLGRGDKSIAQQAADLAANLNRANEPHSELPAGFAELDKDDASYLGWWTRTGC
jgi:hypothetical protein